MRLSLHFADVIDNNDPNQKAMIQVRILPEMKDFDEAKLPWVRPFINTGMSEDQYSMNLPENDSKVWVVFIDEFFREGYYLAGAFIDGFFDFSAVQTSLNKIAELSDTTYNNIRFNRLADGTVIFHNDNTGEVGIYHSSGKYIVIDDSGDITIKADVKVTGNAEITESLQVGSGSQPLTLYTSTEAAMATLLLALSTHVHPDPLTGSVGPSPTLGLTTSTIGLTAAESQKSSSD